MALAPRAAAWPVPAAAAATVLTVALAAVVPQVADVADAAIEWAAVVLVVVACLRYRPRGALWPAVALMLALWAAPELGWLPRALGPGAAEVVVGAAEVVALAIVCVVVWRGRSRGARDPGSRLDLVIICTALGIVSIQEVVVTAAAGDDLSSLLIPTADILILGMLVQVAVTRRGLPTSSRLLLVAAGATLSHDLVAALEGRPGLALGTSTLTLGSAISMLYALAALHPSMTTAFDPRHLQQVRPGSAALLGLLPLVGAPAALWWITSADGSSTLPTWVLLADGTFVAALCLLRAVHALRRSEYLADHDPLTGLPNRRGLARAFAGTSATARSLLLVDVDEFKQVNDTHGHHVGDALLLAVRDVLTRHRTGTDLVARLGGDEFVVLAPSEHAEELARSLVEAVREPVAVAGLELRVSASVGIADAPPGADLDEVLTHADIALYAAKGDGRDTTARFLPEMRADVARRFALTTDVRSLLRGDAGRGGGGGTAGSLELHYQPVVDLQTQTVVSAEALVRWRHPEHGLLPPARFLGLVHGNGLDPALDVAVLRGVVAQLAAWRDAGLEPVPVSVNLTAASLADPSLGTTVLALLAQTDVPPRLLRVEITEHEDLPTDGCAGACLALLDAAGVVVMLDDYGVGYTSLDYLHRFPVRVLKLDRSVTAGVTGETRRLVEAIAGLARTLELELLAEGVETREQCEALLREGVHYGQGYHFHRPAPARVLARLLQDRRAVR